MSNYPKMLYKGNKSKYEYQTASNEESEKVLIDSGWVSFGDLPEPKFESKLIYEPGINKLQTLEKENTKLKEELVEALEEKGDLLKQFESFRNDVVAMKDRIAELQGNTTPVGATNENEERIAELEKLTVPQLKELAASKGIQFKSNASEKTLIELIISSDGAAEVGK